MLHTRFNISRLSHNALIGSIQTANMDAPALTNSESISYTLLHRTLKMLFQQYHGEDSTPILHVDYDKALTPAVIWRLRHARRNLVSA